MSDDFVTLYDSTLRDGAQTPGVDLSLQDKHAIAAALDDFGIDYIEGGFAGSNPLDGEFFASAAVIEAQSFDLFWHDAPCQCVGTARQGIGSAE